MANHTPSFTVSKVVWKISRLPFQARGMGSRASRLFGSNLTWEEHTVGECDSDDVKHVRASWRKGLLEELRVEEEMAARRQDGARETRQSWLAHWQTSQRSSWLNYMSLFTLMFHIWAWCGRLWCQIKHFWIRTDFHWAKLNFAEAKLVLQCMIHILHNLWHVKTNNKLINQEINLHFNKLPMTTLMS